MNEKHRQVVVEGQPASTKTEGAVPEDDRTYSAESERHQARPSAQAKKRYNSTEIREQKQLHRAHPE